jgi:hypothetical protein
MKTLHLGNEFVGRLSLFFTLNFWGTHGGATRAEGTLIFYKLRLVPHILPRLSRLRVARAERWPPSPLGRIIGLQWGSVLLSPVIMFQDGDGDDVIPQDLLPFFPLARH